jgi:PAS domain S-box-containing protein
MHWQNPNVSESGRLVAGAAEAYAPLQEQDDDESSVATTMDCGRNDHTRAEDPPDSLLSRRNKPMMGAWSHRPQLSHLGLFIAAYILGCGFAQSLAIVPGTGISIWPPGGLFLATLVLTSRQSWPWWVLAGCLAELLCNSLWFDSPLPAAFLIYAGNALGAMAGAWLVNRICGRPVRLETVREVLEFVALGAGIAPIISATIGSATLAWFSILSQSFVSAWPLWWIGDATGVLLVAPLALVVLQNWRGEARLSATRWMEAAVLALIFLGIAALSLSGYLPFAYIIVPPLLWAAVRFEFKGAIVTLTLLALITVVFTISGASQFAGDPESQKQRQIMLQLFLAISAFSALIVAAIARQHQQALLTLRKSERELSQLVNMVPSHLWRLTPDGEPIFFNKRMVDFLGLDVTDTDKPGMSRLDVVIEAIHPDDAAAFRDTLRHCLVTGERFSMRYRLRRADGAYRWMSSRAEPMRDQDGRIVQWYGLCHDIDDQMRLYSDIAEREARIRRLIDSDIIGIVIWDLDGTLIDANDAFLRMLQYERKDVEAGLRWFDMTPPDWQEVHAHEETEELAATGKMQAREKEYFRKDGTRVPVLIGAACFEGQSRQGVAYILDLTEHKRAEAALRNRECELSQLVDMVPSYLWRITPDGAPVFFNKRLVDFLGLSVTDADKPDRSRLAAFIEAAIHPDDVLGVAEAFKHSLASGERLSMKWRMRRADGVYRWMAASAEAMRDQDGRIAQWYGLCHDIDDQMHAEEALQRSERELQQLVDALPIHIWSWTPAGKLAYVNKRSLEDLGLSGANLEDCARVAQELVHPEDAPEVLRTSGNCLKTGDAFMMRYRRRWKDGNYRWIEGRCEPLRDRDGTIVHWYQVSIDIDDEMRAQVALRERERFLWQMVDTVPAMIYCAAPDGEPTYRSRQLRDFLGFDVQEKEGPGKSRLSGTLNAAVHPDELAAVKERYAHSLSTGEPYVRRHRLRRVDGEYRWVETRAAAMRNAEGAIVQWNGICLDIEDQVRAQEKLSLAQETLARASQAASLAELSASIAHEVNQPLAAVVANSHACHRWLSADPPNVKRAKITAERITRDANSAADVVSRIRALFRQSVEPRSSIAFPDVITEAHNLMAEEATRRHVRMKIDIESNLPLFTFDRVQVQQVLINLIRNAMDAMDSAEGDRVLGMRVRRTGNVVQTEISDRGQGIEFPDKIFEPFFTTKGNGMGMGLAICRSIVESHGGRLWAEKNEPHGATFIFTLPVETKTTL